MQSVVPTKTALLALFNAASWPGNQPTIRWAGPTERDDTSRAPELIYFAEVQGLEESQAVIGMGSAAPVDEDYNLRIHVDVVQAGDDEQGTETRAWELYSALRQVLVTSRNPVEQAGVVSVRLQDRSGGADRAVTQTNVAVPSAWVVRIQVDQAVHGRVFSP
jgi:hypothetical protein